MADYGGSIEIGGELRESDLPAFIAVLEDAGFYNLDLDMGILLESDRIRNALTYTLDCIKVDPQSLYLSSCSARYGRFEDVEAFCREHGLIFKSHSEAYYDCPAAYGYFDGNTQEYSGAVDEDGEVVIRRISILNYLEAIDKMVKEPCAPLFMNDKSEFYRNVSKIILKSGSNDAVDILKQVIDERYPDLGSNVVPVLTIR